MINDHMKLKNLCEIFINIIDYICVYHFSILYTYLGRRGSLTYIYIIYIIIFIL